MKVKGIILAHFEVLFQYWPGGTRQINLKLQSV